MNYFIKLSKKWFRDNPTQSVSSRSRQMTLFITLRILYDPPSLPNLKNVFRIETWTGKLGILSSGWIVCLDIWDATEIKISFWIRGCQFVGCLNNNLDSARNIITYSIYITTQSYNQILLERSTLITSVVGSTWYKNCIFISRRGTTVYTGEDVHTSIPWSIRTPKWCCWFENERMFLTFPVKQVFDLVNIYITLP